MQKSKFFKKWKKMYDDKKERESIEKPAKKQKKSIKSKEWGKRKVRALGPLSKLHDFVTDITRTSKR